MPPRWAQCPWQSTAFQNAHWLSSRPRGASSLPQGEGGQAFMQLLLLPVSLRVLSAWGLMTSCSAGLLFTPPHYLQPLPRAHYGPLHPSSCSCSETLKERGGGEAPLGRTGQNTHFCCPGAEHQAACPLVEAPLPSHGRALGRCNVAQRPGPVCELGRTVGFAGNTVGLDLGLFHPPTRVTEARHSQTLLFGTSVSSCVKCGQPQDLPPKAWHDDPTDK